MTKEYIKYNGADVKLNSFEGEVITIDKASSVEISGNNVYVTMAVIDESITKITKKDYFTMEIISPLAELDSHKETKLLKVTYDKVILSSVDINFEYGDSKGVTYKIDTSLCDKEISIVDKSDADLLVDKLLEQDKKLNELTKEMNSFRKLVSEKFDKLDNETKEYNCQITSGKINSGAINASKISGITI